MTRAGAEPQGAKAGERCCLSAIVVNWNSGTGLARCLSALLAQGQEAGLAKVVVVDNASADQSASTLAAMGDKVCVVQTGANLGYGRAAVVGLAQTTTPLVVILNPDVEVQAGSLKALHDCLVADSGCGLVGPRLLTPSGRTQASCGSVPTVWGEICGRFLLHLAFPFLKFRGRRPSKLKPTGWVTGACFMARRSALDAVGGPDTAIFMYYEDIDLCVRLQQAGWRVCYQPEAVARHVGGGSSRQVLENMLVVSEQSYLHYVKKHFRPGLASVLQALRPVEMGLRWLLWGFLGTLRPSLRDEARSRRRAYTIMMRRKGVRAGRPVDAE